MQSDSRTTNQPRKRRRKNAEKPGEPRPARSAYNFFFKAQQENAKSEVDGVARTIVEIGAAWRGLDPSEKAYYEGLAASDRQRYALELVQWKQSEEQKADNSADERKESTSPETSTGSGTSAVKGLASLINPSHPPDTINSNFDPISLPRRGDFGSHLTGMAMTAHALGGISSIPAPILNSQLMSTISPSLFGVQGNPWSPSVAYYIPSFPSVGTPSGHPFSHGQRLQPTRETTTVASTQDVRPGSFAWLAQELGEEGVDLFIRLFK